jgi:hypothetical protein
MPLIGPAIVTVAKCVNTVVYAWGSACDNHALALQILKLEKGRR